MDLQDLERMIQDVIPAKLDSFPKLREEGDPYHFKEWDGMGQEILRYWFWNRKGNKKNSKRVFINEIAVLVKHCIPKGTIERSDFELYRSPRGQISTITKLFQKLRPDPARFFPFLQVHYSWTINCLNFRK